MDLQKIIEALSDASADCVLIGGAALAAHGSSYVTQDVDLAYARNDENIDRLVKALKPFNPRLRVQNIPEGLPFQFDRKTIKNGSNFTMETDVGAIDILGGVTGFASYSELVSLAEPMEITMRDPTPEERKRIAKNLRYMCVVAAVMAASSAIYGSFDLLRHSADSRMFGYFWLAATVGWLFALWRVYSLMSRNRGQN